MKSRLTTPYQPTRKERETLEAQRPAQPPSITAAKSVSCCASATRFSLASCSSPGQRPVGEAVSGTTNMLCSDRYTDMGEEATYQSTYLDRAATRKSLGVVSTEAGTFPVRSRCPVRPVVSVSAPKCKQ